MSCNFEGAFLLIGCCWSSPRRSRILVAMGLMAADSSIRGRRISRSKHDISHWYAMELKTTWRYPCLSGNARLSVVNGRASIEVSPPSL